MFKNVAKNTQHWDGFNLKNNSNLKEALGRGDFRFLLLVILSVFL